MTPAGEKSTARGRHLAARLLLALLATLPSCARPLAERAIAARGGALTSLTRFADADVHQGFPGTWSWRVDYRTPDLLRWALETYGEEQTFAWDGAQVRYFLGSASLPPDSATEDDFRTVVRWTAVTMLGVLEQDDRVEVEEMSSAELPAGAAAGLRVRYRDDGATYELYFDRDALLVAARGPVVIPTIGAGELEARFSDFRTVDGFVLPYVGSYTLAGRPLFDERVLRYVPDDPALDAASFRRPPPLAR